MVYVLAVHCLFKLHGQHTWEDYNISIHLKTPSVKFNSLFSVKGKYTH